MVIMALCNPVTYGHRWSQWSQAVTAGHTSSQLVKLVIVKDLKIVDLKGYYDLV